MARVGRIRRASEEARIGVLMVTLMGLLTKALAVSECVNELEGKCAIEERAGESYGFMIAMVMMLLGAWALGFCSGWLAYSLTQVRPRFAWPDHDSPDDNEDTETRTMSTQSPTTYAWNDQFAVMSAERHGAWAEWSKTEWNE